MADYRTNQGLNWLLQMRWADRRRLLLAAMCMFLVLSLLLVLACVNSTKTVNEIESPEDAEDKTFVLGAVTVKDVSFFVKISEYDLVGRLFGSPVFEVQEVTLVPVDSKPEKTNTAFIEQLEDYFEDAGFYFSLDDRLTLNAQCIFSKCDLKHSAYLTANNFMLQQFDNLDNTSGYTAVKAIRGHVSMGCLEFDNKLVCGSIISRTSTARTSTRFASRGGDANGNVSNFVETEMVIACGRDHGSIVQVRGSIPFCWGQTPAPNKFAPNFEIEPDKKVNESVFKKHIKILQSLFQNYKILILNLVDQGKEKKEHDLGQYFTDLFDLYQSQEKDANIRYLPFNYHHEIHQGDWKEKMLKLVKDLIQPSFHFAIDGFTHQDQTTIVRTNCVDCLDRTNAAQSVIAKEAVLPEILQSLNIALNAHQLTELDKLLGHFWARNANAISLQYAGSKALKTDIAKMGRRTRRGVLKDWQTSAKRYFNANWRDKIRKECMLVVYGPGSSPKEE